MLFHISDWKLLIDKLLCFIQFNKIALISQVWLKGVSKIINNDCLTKEMLIYLESSFSEFCVYNENPKSSIRHSKNSGYNPLF